MLKRMACYTCFLFAWCPCMHQRHSWWESGTCPQIHHSFLADKKGWHQNACGFAADGKQSWFIIDFE